MSDPPLGDLTQLLQSAEVEHMVVGSTASTYYGPARATQDIDVVIEIEADQLDRLLSGLDPDRFYVPVEAARTAVRSGGQFNLIDLSSEWKIDLIIRQTRPFSLEEFARRRPVRIDGVEVSIASPEDVVLSKLEWAKASGSDRQVEDAASVLRSVGEALDRAYLDRWAEDLAVTDLLAKARALADR